MKTKNFDPKQIDIVWLDGLVGDIEVEVVDDPNSSVRVDIENDSNDLIKTEITNGKLRVYRRKKSGISFSFFYSSGEEDVKVYLPAKKSLKINSFSADIDIYSKTSDSQNLLLNKLKIDQKSGDMSIKNMIISKMNISNYSGDFNVDKSYIKDFNIKMYSGDFDFTRSGFDEANLNILSGDMDISVMTSFDRLIVSSKSGDVNLTIPFEKLDYAGSILAGDFDVSSKIVYAKDAPKFRYKMLAGDVEIKNKKTMNNVINNLKSHFEIYEKNKKQVFDDDVQRILNLLLDKKINEKEASELLKSMDVSQDKRDEFFEEYLLIKMSQDQRKSKDTVEEEIKKENTDEDFFDNDKKQKDEAKKNNIILEDKLNEVIDKAVNDGMNVLEKTIDGSVKVTENVQDIIDKNMNKSFDESQNSKKNNHDKEKNDEDSSNNKNNDKK